MIFIYLFIAGLFFGSFLNVLADRLSRDETILGRSKCESCKHELSFLDLIPIFSYLFLKGKCRYCRKKFSIQYPIAEIFTGVVFVITWYLSHASSINPIINSIHLVFASCLIVIILADLRYQIIPDQLQISLVVVQIIKSVYLNYFIFHADILHTLKLLADNFTAGIVVMLPLLLIYLLSKGKGMGFGDVKFAFVIGFILGIFSGFGALYISFIAGGLVGVVLLIMKKGKRKSKLPFGPFLVLGLYTLMFFENDIILILSKIYGI